MKNETIIGIIAIIISSSAVGVVIGQSYIQYLEYENSIRPIIAVSGFDKNSKILSFIYQNYGSVPNTGGTISLDADGDGIEDRRDQCLFLPETFNDYADWDGCPDSEGAASTDPTRFDSDGDRFYDTVDHCPTSPETWNKYRDNDGCPDIAPEQQRFVHDDDLDGVINDQDACPIDPEDYDGDRDSDGCPDQ